MAINSETLARAALEGRDLWAEAAQRKFQVIFMSPEMLKDTRFRDFVQCETIMPWLGLMVIDEIHLSNEWGVDFREALHLIWQVRPWLPD